jgi:hypothetical protein
MKPHTTKHPSVLALALVVMACLAWPAAAQQVIEAEPAATDRDAPAPVDEEPAGSRFYYNRHARPNPLAIGPEKIAFTDTLRMVMQYWQEEGWLEPPDFNKPIEDIQADSLRYLEGSKVDAQGNVRLRLDTIDFSADRFYYERETGTLDASGSVVMRQENALITADRLRYSPPLAPVEDTSADPAAMLLPAGSPPADGKLKLGSFDAENLHMTGAYRELQVRLFRFDSTSNTGELLNASGHLGPLYFNADRIQLLGEGEAVAENIWFSTCDQDPPAYSVYLRSAVLRENQVIDGKGLRLRIRNVNTPLYWPRWVHQAGEDDRLRFQFDSGRDARIGYFVNMAQHFEVNPEVTLGLRLYPTEKAGIGVGLEGSYDYLDTPAKPLFGGKGTFRSMITTKEDGYIEFYHWQRMFEDTELRLQWEQWFKRDFVKDFYYEVYRNRTEPRTFANVTHNRPDYIVSGTVRATTNDFVNETERLPEVAFHLLERPLAERLYLTFDSVTGYNEREPEGTGALRTVNVARLTLDLDLDEAFSVIPFAETEVTWYSKRFDGAANATRASFLLGTTAQTRFHKTYAGAAGFSGFKHLIIPSATLSYRPSPTIGVDETPRFDAYDNVYGRTRFETKLDNIVMGRDAETGDIWQVARLTFFTGHDIWNELRRSQDLEVEIDIRPRPWWGFLVAGEHHKSSKDINLDSPFSYQRALFSFADQVLGFEIDPEDLFTYNAQYGNYERFWTLFYFDDRAYGGKWNAKIGFAYTRTRDTVFNRELLYGGGYQLSDDWAVSFEHRYDFEREELVKQTYEIRRRMHCWESALQFRERSSGWDVGFELSLVAFPGSKVKF